MTEELVRKTQNGDVPGMPSAEDILGKMGLAGGWENVLKTAAGQPLVDGLRARRQELELAYAACFSTPAGEKVLQDLFDQTFRRNTCPPERGSIEADALYHRERNGQNSTAFYICKMIEAGRDGKKKPAGKRK